MEKRFVCKKCGERFTADDKGFVKCPQCGSDNVDFAPRNLKPLWCSLLLIICVVAIIYWLRRPVPDEPTLPPVLELKEKPKYNEDEGTYDCTIRVVNPPKQKYEITVSEKGSENPEQTSKKGKFKNLPALESDVPYVFRLYDIEADSILYVLESYDFPKPTPIIKDPWTREQLEEHMNAGEYLGGDEHFASDIKIIITNVPDKFSRQYDTISKIVEDVVTDGGSTVKIEYVEYNKKGQISKVKLSSDWFVVPEDE